MAFKAGDEVFSRLHGAGTVLSIEYGEGAEIRNSLGSTVGTDHPVAVSFEGGIFSYDHEGFYFRAGSSLRSETPDLELIGD